MFDVLSQGLSSLIRRLTIGASIDKKAVEEILQELKKILLQSDVDMKLADELIIFLGNRILGGKNSLTAISGKNREGFNEAIKITPVETKMFGEDIMVRGKPCFQE